MMKHRVLKQNVTEKHISPLNNKLHFESLLPHKLDNFVVFHVSDILFIGKNDGIISLQLSSSGWRANPMNLQGFNKIPFKFRSDFNFQLSESNAKRVEDLPNRFVCYVLVAYVCEKIRHIGLQKDAFLFTQKKG